VNDVNLHDAPKVTEAYPNKQLAFTRKSKRLAKTQTCFWFKTAPLHKHLSASWCLHFAWGVAEAKCILITAVCVSVPRRLPTLLHGPGCKLEEW